jgi:hypothetical protein
MSGSARAITRIHYLKGAESTGFATSIWIVVQNTLSKISIASQYSLAIPGRGVLCLLAVALRMGGSLAIGSLAIQKGSQNRTKLG